MDQRRGAAGPAEPLMTVPLDQPPRVRQDRGLRTADRASQSPQVSHPLRPGDLQCAGGTPSRQVQGEQPGITIQAQEQRRPCRTHQPGPATVQRGNQGGRVT